MTTSLRRFNISNILLKQAQSKRITFKHHVVFISSIVSRSSSKYHHKTKHSLFYSSVRYKVPNQKLMRHKKQVDKMDFDRANRHEFNKSGHKDVNYSPLDHTLNSEEFLRDIDSELIDNTYIEYNNHWMKKFMKFTDAEFESFNTKSIESNPTDNTSSTSTAVGYSKLPEIESSEISQTFQYLDEWKKKVKEKQLIDDYNVKLPNGSIIAYSEYLNTLDNKQNTQYGKHLTEKQLIAIKRHKEYPAMEPMIDKYGRAHGKGRRKTCRARASVYSGDGSIYICGKHYSEYFHNYVDRMNISLPFLVTDTERRMNAWCIVKGGGDSGQSHACRQAIARALAKYEPQLYPILYSYKLWQTDWRKRERKKPGKPKARKSVQWKAR